MKSSTRNKIILILIIIIQLILMLYFGSLKKGMHFDECFSYFNTNNSVGRQAYDRDFVTREDILKDFYVKPGEEFNYSYVVKLQSYDVHPPVFYILLHTVCSFMPGIFSMWQGLGLNILYTVIASILLYVIIYKLFEDEYISLLAMGLYAFNTGVICNMLYIRMYCLMTLWIVLAIYFHVKMGIDEKRGEFKYKYIVYNAILSLLGFLTHYFYLVFLFFLELGYWLPILLGSKQNFKNNIKKCILYGTGVLMGGIAGVVLYPSCLGHVNSGYRGQEVKGYLLNLADFGDRLSFFNSLMNKYVFNNMMYVYLLVAALLLVTLFYRSRHNKNILNANEIAKNQENNGLKKGLSLFIRCIIVPVLGYYFVSAKASLMGDEAMMRYQLPIYGLVFVSVFIITICSVKLLIDSKKIKKYSICFIVSIFVIPLFAGIFNKNVFYLYSEQEKMEQIAESNKDKACLYIYNNENSKYFIWNDAMQLAKYEKVYFASSEDLTVLTESEIANADDLIVYISVLDELEDFNTYSNWVMDSNSKLSKCEKLYDGMYAECYLFE